MKIHDVLANAIEQGIGERAAARANDIPLHELRREESRTGDHLRGFPKSTELIPYEQLLHMITVDQTPMAGISDELQVSRSMVVSAIKFYQIDISPETRAVMRRKAYDIARSKYRAMCDDPVRSREIRAKTKATNMRKYGVESPTQSPDVKARINKTLRRKYGKGGSPFANKSVRDKAKKTMIERYGVDISWKSEEVKAKIRRTNIQRYGDAVATRSPAVKNKSMNTNMERYGVKWNTVSPEAREKAKASYMRHYGVDNPSKSPEVLNKIARSMNRGESANEKMVADLLDSIGVAYRTNDHDMIGQELDFVIPSAKLAIEVSPCFTHHSNESQVLTIKPKKRSYHKHKHDMVEQLGYELITLTDSHMTRERWRDLTSPFLTLKATGRAEHVMYGRTVTISHETTRSGRRECGSFIDKYHFSGNTPASDYFSVRDAGGAMVGAFSLRKPRKSTGGDIELARLVWRNDVQVRYGLSKIVHTIARTIPANTLLSYSDNSMGNGYSYMRAGFAYQGDTEPGLHFVNPHDPMDNYSWQVATPWGAKSGIIARLIRPMEITKKEAKIIVEKDLPHRSDDGKGYFAYYDTGSKRWEYDLRSLR
jgi:hypothetical protein